MEITITLPADHSVITIQELLEREWLVPRKVRHFLRTRKNVWVNAQLAPFHSEIRGGDTITLHFEKDDYSHQEIILGNAKKIQVLYEDEQLVIVNKPAGLKTHPNDVKETGTLLNDLAAYLAPKKQKPYVVHRLDQETSGAILFAKNPFILPILSQLVEQKKIYRRYQAVVWGKLTKDLTITKKMGRDRHNRRKQVIDDRNGKTAVTHVTIAKNLPTQTQIYCVLSTGRTHQIRVHLESLGHPIVGDPLYQSRPAKRMMLHAIELHLTHPFTQERILVRAAPGLW